MNTSFPLDYVFLSVSILESWVKGRGHIYCGYAYIFIYFTYLRGTDRKNKETFHVLVHSLNAHNFLRAILGFMPWVLIYAFHTWIFPIRKMFCSFNTQWCLFKFFILK